MPGKIKNIALVAAISLLTFTGCNKSSPTGGATPTWQTVFSDDFNRADSSSLGANYFTDIQPQELGGTFSIFNNKARVAGGKYWVIGYVVGVPNQTVRVSATIVTTTAPSGPYGVAVSARDSADYHSGYGSGIWSKGNDSYVPIDSAAGIVTFSTSLSTSTMSSLTSQGYLVKKGGSYLLELTFDAGTLTFVVTDLATNAAKTLSVTPVSARAGEMLGMLGDQSTGDTTFIENFKVEKYE